VVLDASGLIALFLAEPRAAWIRARLKTSVAPLRMSWVNATEVAMSMERKALGGGGVAMDLLARSQIELLAPDREIAVLVAEARQRFPLNFGDCFAYAHAKLLDEPLLTLVADFLKTDLAAVLHPDG